MQAYIRAKEKMGELYDKRLEARQNLDEWDEIMQAIGGEGKTLRKNRPVLYTALPDLSCQQRNKEIQLTL